MLELAALCEIIWAWRRFLAICTILAAGCAAVVVYVRTPTYRADRTLVAGPMLEAFPLSETDLRLGQELARNFAHLTVSDPILRGAADRLGGTVETGQLGAGVSAQALPGTQFVRISAVGSTPDEARSMADAVARQLMEAVAERSGGSDGIMETLKRELRGLEVDLRSARAELERLRAEAGEGETDDTRARIAALERKLDGWRSSYVTILNQAKGSQRLAFWDAAGVPATPVSPAPGFTILAAAFGIFAVAVVGILLFEYPFRRGHE